MDKFFATEENKKLEDEVWRKFLDKLKKNIFSKNSGEILENLLSSYEKKELARRLAVIALLSEGKTYRKISEILGVSHQTIRAIKKCALENSSKFYNPYRKKEKKGKPVPPISLIDDLADILSNWPTYSGKGRWRFLYKK